MPLTHAQLDVSDSNRTWIFAVAYYRMSTSQQDTSIDQQRVEVEKYAEQHGFKIVREYIDEGVSGDKTHRRVQFQQMIADAAGGDFEFVLCWDQDRFGRFDSIEAGKWLSPLLEAGVGLATVAQGTIDFDDFSGRIVYSVNQEAKNNYLRDLSRNISRRFHQAALAGNLPGGCAAYGYDRAYLDADAKEIMRVGRREQPPIRRRNIRIQLVPGDPEEVRWVQWMFNTYANEDVGMRYIQDTLNENEVPAPRSKFWTIAAIHKIMTNQRYCGDLVYGTTSAGEYHVITKEGIEKVKGRKRRKNSSRKNNEENRIVVPNTHEALVDRATFQRVQEKRRKNKVRTVRSSSRTEYLLSGLLHCQCGGRMTGRRKGDRIFYLCDAYLRYGTKCGCRLWNVHQSVFMDFVMRLVEGVVDDKANVRKLRTAIRRELKARGEVDPKRAKSLRTKLARLDEEIDTATERVMTAPEDLSEILFPKLREMQERKRTLEAQLADTSAVRGSGDLDEQTDIVMAGFSDFVAEYRKANPRHLNELVRRIISRVDFKFGVKPGSEHLKRKTYQITSGVLKLHCPLPSSVVHLASSELCGTSSDSDISSWPQRHPESRMRENRTSGSEVRRSECNRTG